MKWKVGKSKIHGNGVFATKDLEPSEDIGIGISLINDDEKERVFQRNTFGLLINDSNDPNVVCKKINDDWHFVAIRPIKDGEELLVSYKQYENQIDIESIRERKRVAVL